MNQGFPTGVGKSAVAANRPEANVSVWKRALVTWFEATAPVDPGARADFATREAFRRGLLASLALLLAIAMVIVYMLVMGITANNNWPVYLAGGGSIFILSVATGMLNRRGHLFASACMLMLIIDGGIVTILLFVRGGLGLVNLPVFDLLIGSELIAVSLLAPSSVLVVATINSAIVIVITLFSHHNPDLDQYLALNGLGVVLARPILLQFGVAAVTVLWVSSALNALKRADQAEELAEMEHAIAEYERAQAAQKRSLEHGIQYLVETQRQVSNGDLTARVPITQDNTLWPVAISFNNLLTRFQHLQEDADQLQQIYREMPRLVNAIREARQARHPVVLPRGGTVLDALVAELTENRSGEAQQ